MTGKSKSSFGTFLRYILATILIMVSPVLTVNKGFSDEQKAASTESELISQNGGEKEGDKYRTGPHAQLACDECHTMEGGKISPTASSSASDGIEMCLRCHAEVNTHPIGVDILPESSAETHSLPLSKNDREGKIVCLTCHEIHLAEEGHSLLKGTQTTYRSKRTSLCLHCHLDRFQDKSPHVEDEKGCGFCHIARPTEKESQQDPPDLRMQASCDLCHYDLDDSHYLGSDPFLDADIREEAIRSGMLSGNGQPACTSCHDHHGKTDGKGILSVAYITLCSKSRSIDPHWNDLHCLSCHERQPLKGDAPLLEKGDSNALCNRCHASVYARSDIHPVGIKPSEHVRIPADMILEDGKLTCATCHDSLRQVGCVKKEKRAVTNILFLRGKQKSRNSFCFLCHFEETYKLLNPHDQVNEKGQIQEETCLFCHSSIPDLQIRGPEKVSFVVQNPDAYCIGCHHGFTRKHPAGIDHLRIPSEKILATLETSIQRIGVELPLFKGKVVCATCHNPHQTGVIQFSAAATGTKRGNKLRLMPGLMQCVGCHWDKR